MVQCANYAGLLTSLPTVEEVLDDHASELGHDFMAYRNHVYRVANLCLAIRGRQPRRAREDSCRCRLPRPRDLDEQYVRLHRSISRDRAQAPRGSRVGGVDPRDRGDDRGSP